MNKQPQPDLFANTPALPEGVDYRQNVITSADEAEYVRQFATLPFKPFEFHGYLGNRRVVSFGWRYDYAGRTLRESNPIPDFLRDNRRCVGMNRRPFGEGERTCD